MDNVHLCLSDLLDQDLTAYEYFQTLPGYVQAALRDREISTFQELLECAERVRSSGLYG